MRRINRINKFYKLAIGNKNIAPPGGHKLYKRKNTITKNYRIEYFSIFISVLALSASIYSSLGTWRQTSIMNQQLTAADFNRNYQDLLDAQLSVCDMLRRKLPLNLQEAYIQTPTAITMPVGYFINQTEIPPEIISKNDALSQQKIFDLVDRMNNKAELLEVWMTSDQIKSFIGDIKVHQQQISNYFIFETEYKSGVKLNISSNEYSKIRVRFLWRSHLSCSFIIKMMRAWRLSEYDLVKKEDEEHRRNYKFKEPAIISPEDIPPMNIFTPESYLKLWGATAGQYSNRNVPDE
ncbi:hypothetical protein [Rhizobium sp. CSW-27]|uniref:hypothetical protein n=1 Tax=Rhizobium sp. CSW-27 TaxID=2839985 RepID=UPI001C038C18|nr:hypothetical protein [Rhizobium sp. CSW-27]MBT9373167.1 hypothetical protein [Rhizobium sp. CSW-27]